MPPLLILWLGLGALIILGLRPFLGGWGTAAVVVWPPYVLLGLALTAAALKASIRPGIPPSLRSFRPLLIFALGGGVLFAVHPLLARYSDSRVFQVRLARSQTTYDSLVAQLPVDSTSGGWRWHGDLRYLVDSGPPARIAILQAGRGYDGAEVALYDPAGPLDLRLPESGQARLFDSRLGTCDSIRHPWYRCSFRRPARASPPD